MGPASRQRGRPVRVRPSKGVAIVAAMIVVTLLATGCGSNAGAPKASVTHAHDHGR